MLFQEQQEATGLDVQLLQLGTMEDPGGATHAGRGGGRPLVGQRVEPVEGLADFGGAETGLDQAVLERVAVADRVRVFGEVVFEQVQQYIQDALFHCPSACVVDAVEVKKPVFLWYRPCSAVTKPSSSMTSSMEDSSAAVNPVRETS